MYSTIGADKETIKRLRKMANGKPLTQYLKEIPTSESYYKAIRREIKELKSLLIGAKSG